MAQRREGRRDEEAALIAVGCVVARETCQSFVLSVGKIMVFLRVAAREEIDGTDIRCRA